MFYLQLMNSPRESHLMKYHTHTVTVFTALVMWTINYYTAVVMTINYDNNTHTGLFLNSK